MIRKLPAERVVKLIEADMLTNHMMHRQQVSEEIAEREQIESRFLRRKKIFAWCVIGSMLLWVVVGLAMQVLHALFGR